MKKTLVVLCVLLITETVFAQKKKQQQIVPGYRGLKCTIKYDCGINASWYDIHTTKMPMLFHNAEVSYVVSRKHEIVARYTYNSYNSLAPQSFEYEADRPENPGGEQVWYSPTGNYTSVSHSAAVLCKFYYGGLGYIAPVGRYITLGVTYVNNVTNTSYQTGAWSSDGYGTYTLPPLALRKRVTSHDFYATVEFGRNFIIANRIVMDIAATINVPVSGFVKMGMNDTNWDKAFLGEINYDNMLKNVFQFKVGLGVLAF